MQAAVVLGLTGTGEISGRVAQCSTSIERHPAVRLPVVHDPLKSADPGRIERSSMLRPRNAVKRRIAKGLRLWPPSSLRWTSISSGGPLCSAASLN